MTYYPIAYMYQADFICPDCIVEMLEFRYGVFPVDEHNVDQAVAQIGSALGFDVNDEYTYDSDVFPKVLFDYDLTEDEVCGYCFNSFI